MNSKEAWPGVYDDMERNYRSMMHDDTIGMIPLLPTIQARNMLLNFFRLHENDSRICGVHEEYTLRAGGDLLATRHGEGSRRLLFGD